MNQSNVEASPLRRDQIRNIASAVRELLGQNNKPWVDVAWVVQFGLYKVMDNYSFEVGFRSEMKENHGLSDVPNQKIILREDIYEGMCDGKGRDRMTAAHEFGHLLLHGPGRLKLRRSSVELKAYADPEWQAKAFAGEFLVNGDYISEQESIAELSVKFGISRQAAQIQVRANEREGLTKKGPISKIGPQAVA